MQRVKLNAARGSRVPFQLLTAKPFQFPSKRINLVQQATPKSPIATLIYALGAVHQHTVLLRGGIGRGERGQARPSRSLVLRRRPSSTSCTDTPSNPPTFTRYSSRSDGKRNPFEGGYKGVSNFEPSSGVSQTKPVASFATLPAERQQLQDPRPRVAALSIDRRFDSFRLDSTRSMTREQHEA